MDEITKCRGENCKLKLNCLRFTSPENVLNLKYEVFIKEAESGICSGFWDNFNQIEDENKLWRTNYEN